MPDPWIKFYPSDWLAGTSGLTAAERGVYITIVAMIYEKGGPVTLDYTRLGRRCGVPAGTFRRILAALLDEGKLIETDEGLTNDRAQRELDRRKNEKVGRQTGARKTNTKRAQKTKEKQGKCERSPLRSDGAIPEPEPDTEETSVSSGGEAARSDFEEALWTHGVRFLEERGVKRARAVIGQWRKSYADADIFNAFKAANRERAVEPVAFITATLQRKGKANGRTKPSGADIAREVARRAAERMGGGSYSDPSEPLLPAGQSGGCDDGSPDGLGGDAEWHDAGGDFPRLRLISP